MKLACSHILDQGRVRSKLVFDFGEYGAAWLTSGQVRDKFLSQLHLLEFTAGFKFSIARHGVLPN